MQCADGGWAAFDADNTRTLCRAHPFCDFGEVIDPPSADVTAHAIEMLALEGKTDNARVQRGIAWLRAAQEPDGSWFGRWGANFIYGTGAAVPALVAAGVSPDDPSIRRAVHWLASRQNPDGGWGEDLRSYDDPAGWSGRGASTASQTAWALLALVAAGDDGSMDAPRRRLPRRYPARRRLVGRAAVHGHRLPGRVLRQLSPLPADLSRHGARPLRERLARRATNAIRAGRRRWNVVAFTY